MTQEAPKRRASDRLPEKSDGQKEAKLLKQMMQGLCILIIILQGFDAVSTFIALDTGHLVEKNFLLTRAAKLLEAPIQSVVLGSKILVASLFVLLMVKQKPTINAVVVLFFVAAFYLTVVQRNFYWVSIVQAIHFK